MNIIEFNNVSKNLTNFKLQPTSFYVKDKEILGILGKKDSGKSTIYKLILNFLKPTKGDIEVFGLNSQTESKEIKIEIGAVPQSNWFIDNMRPVSLLKQTIRSRGKKTYDEIEFLIEYFDLKLGRKIGDLSYLDKRKLALINALVANPQLIIIDEPDNIPDTSTRIKLYDILEEKNREGATVILLTSNLKEAQSICHRILYFMDGELIETEDQRNKLSNDKILRFYDKDVNKEIFYQIGCKLVKTGNESVFYYNGPLDLLAEAIYKSGLIDYTVEDSTLDEKISIIEKERILPSSNIKLENTSSVTLKKAEAGNKNNLKDKKTEPIKEGQKVEALNEQNTVIISNSNYEELIEAANSQETNKEDQNVNL